MKICKYCEKPVFAKGMCATHYFRVKRHNDPEYSIETTQNIYIKNNMGYIALYDRNKKLAILAICDVEDIPRIKKRTWRYEINNRRIIDKQNKQMLSRFILKIRKKTQQHVKILFLNGDSSDFRKKNMRLVTQTIVSSMQIRTNRRKKEKYIGVWSQNNRFYASIGHKRKKIYLGAFPNPEQAALAYNRKAKELYGDLARINIIERT